MAKKISIKAKAVTSTPGGQSTDIRIDSSYGIFYAYLNAYTPTFIPVNGYMFGFVDISVATVNLLALEVKTTIDYFLTQNGISFESEVIGDTANFYIGNNTTTEIIGFGVSYAPDYEYSIFEFTQEDYEFEAPTEPVVLPDALVLSRSPYNVNISPNVAFDSASLNLKVYRGQKTVDAPANVTFPLSKSVVQAGQTTISFQINKLINDYCKNSIISFASTGVSTSSFYDTVWVDSVLTAYYLGEEVGIVNQSFYAVDGYGKFTELFNPQITVPILSTISSHIIYRGSDYPLYFISTDLVSISINGSPITFTLDDTINNQLIAYINIGGYVASLSSFTAVFTYSSATYTHTFTVEDVCKYPLYNVFFKNKFGFWQSIPFNLKSMTTLDVESSDYMPIISSFGQYSATSHNKRTYMPVSMEKYTVNTDYIPEAYNDLFYEMMNSEFHYLENNGNYIPVNLESKSFQKKLKTFDKLIQYTVSFIGSNNYMNDIT